MRISKLISALGACLVLGFATTAFAQEQEDEDYILEVTKVGVKIGQEMKFREAVKAYHQCLIDNEYEGNWSTWSNVGGEGREYHFVSTMNNWAEMDSPHQAGETCWAEHHDNLTPHANSVAVIFARPMSDWSGEAEDYTVVRLHHFRVDDNREFRDAVSAITSILKDAEYEHLGEWYQTIGGGADKPNYFVVAHYDNFAALDEDRTGPYQALVDAAGQERADELWEQFDDALRDDREYFSDLLRRDDELSYSGGD